MRSKVSTFRFWLFDVDADVQITYEAEKVPVQESTIRV